MDLIGFFAALYSSWVSFMSGVFSVAFTALGFYLTNQAMKRVFWGLAVVSFILACIRIWTVEHRTAAYVPKLTINPQPSFISDMPNKAVVVVFASISNVGAPTTINGWKLEIRRPGENAITYGAARFTAGHSQEVPYVGDPGSVYVIWGDDSLPEKNSANSYSNRRGS